MGPVVQFVLALAVAATALGGGSLAWPRITAKPRPVLLQNVHDFVVKTPVGQRTADVLGVTDESSVEPVNLGEVASTIVNSAKSAAQQRIQKIVIGNAVNELTRQYDRLPEDQKQYIQQALCTPQIQTQSPSVVQ